MVGGAHLGSILASPQDMKHLDVNKLTAFQRLTVDVSQSSPRIPGLRVQRPQGKSQVVPAVPLLRELPERRPQEVLAEVRRVDVRLGEARLGHPPGPDVPDVLVVHALPALQAAQVDVGRVAQAGLEGDGARVHVELQDEYGFL